MLTDEIRRQIILNDYRFPYRKKLQEGSDYESYRSNSESCIDDITVQVKKSENKIEEINFDGEACAISTASTSLLLKAVEGKSFEDAIKLLDEYKKMIDGAEYDKDLLEDLNAFSNIHLQPNRVNCALIGAITIEKLIKGGKDNE